MDCDNIENSSMIRNLQNLNLSCNSFNFSVPKSAKGTPSFATGILSKLCRVSPEIINAALAVGAAFFSAYQDNE